MKLYLISDNTDTLTGMRLAGIEGVVVHKADEMEEALEAAKANPDYGIILITEKLARDFPDIAGPAKEAGGLPLIIEIPDRHGSSRTPHFITDYISEAVGLGAGGQP